MAELSIVHRESYFISYIMDLQKSFDILLHRREASTAGCCNSYDSNVIPLTGRKQNLQITKQIKKLEQSDTELLQMLFTLQSERVMEYANFSAGIEHLIQNSRLSEYPQLVAEITSRFAVISEHIIRIKEEFLLRGKDSWHCDVTKIQSFEKEKLILFASLQLDLIQAANPGLIQIEGNSVITNNPTYATNRIEELEEKVSESLENLRSDLSDESV